MSAGATAENGMLRGAPARHIDQATADLDRLAHTWLDLQSTLKGAP